jgi:hypothetical protein
VTEPTSPAPEGRAVIEGPATLAEVADWLDQSDGEDAPTPRRQLGFVVSATNVWVRRLHPGTVADGVTSWDVDVELGATMLAGRLWRRRDSPAGVETFAGDGAVYVQRTDPDVAMLLQIGAYAPPRVG